MKIWFPVSSTHCIKFLFNHIFSRRDDRLCLEESCASKKKVLICWEKRNEPEIVKFFQIWHRNFEKNKTILSFVCVFLFFVLKLTNWIRIFLSVYVCFLSLKFIFCWKLKSSFGYSGARNICFKKYAFCICCICMNRTLKKRFFDLLESDIVAMRYMQGVTEFVSFILICNIVFIIVSKYICVRVNDESSCLCCCT